jgi:hypothetical protein
LHNFHLHKHCEQQQNYEDYVEGKKELCENAGELVQDLGDGALNEIRLKH